MLRDELKPGTQIRVTTDKWSGEGTPSPGDIGTVKNPDRLTSGNEILVDFPKLESSWYLLADDFELAVGGKRIQFSGGGMRDSQADKPRFDLLMPKAVPFESQFLTRAAVHMAKGAEKYEDRNWEEFSDQESLDRAKASALRHMHQWIAGESDEDHAAAVFFNLMAADYIRGRIDGEW